MIDVAAGSISSGAVVSVAAGVVAVAAVAGGALLPCLRGPRLRCPLGPSGTFTGGCGVSGAAAVSGSLMGSKSSSKRLSGARVCANSSWTGVD